MRRFDHNMDGTITITCLLCGYKQIYQSYQSYGCRCVGCGEEDLKKFEIRQNCEYVLLVEAKSEEVALKIAHDTPLSEWSASWSSMETEPSGEE